MLLLLDVLVSEVPGFVHVLGLFRVVALWALDFIERQIKSPSGAQASSALR